jgi:hypothetical protein
VIGAVETCAVEWLPGIGHVVLDDAMVSWSCFVGLKGGDRVAVERIPPLLRCSAQGLDLEVGFKVYAASLRILEGVAG